MSFLLVLPCLIPFLFALSHSPSNHFLSFYFYSIKWYVFFYFLFVYQEEIILISFSSFIFVQSVSLKKLLHYSIVCFCVYEVFSLYYEKKIYTSSFSFLPTQPIIPPHSLILFPLSTPTSPSPSSDVVRRTLQVCCRPDSEGTGQLH